MFKTEIETKEADKWADYKKLRNEITSDTRKAKSAYFKRKFDKVKVTSAYWNLLSRATNPKARKSIGPLKRDDESLVVDDKRKADLLNCSFATVGMKLADTINPQYRTRNTIKPKPTPCIYDTRVSYDEVANKLITLKTNKATGPDGILIRLLAAAGGTSIAGPLTNLYLRSLREAKVYNDWKVARLNRIFKKYDESDIGNYRQLSMLSVPSKILESYVTDSIVEHVFTRNQLVTEYQWAYRKGHSTGTDLLLAHLTEIWRCALDSNLVVGVLFIDFQKAFLTKP